MLGMSLLLFLLCGGSGYLAAAERIVIPVAGKSQNSKEMAVEDARKQAVEKALARIITPDAESAGIFQKVAAKYSLLSDPKVNVMQTKIIKGQTVVFCKVTVQIDALTNELQEQIKNVQDSEAHQDDQAFFFVRVTGAFNPQEKQREQANVLRFYADAFQALGIQKGMEDGIAVQSMERYQTLDTAGYINAVCGEVQQDMSIGLAVIGEIRLEPSVMDEDGTNSTCVSRIIVVRNGSDGTMETVGTFEDTYTIRRTDRLEAEKLVLQKAAYNSSKYLAHLTLSYWDSHK